MERVKVDGGGRGGQAGHGAGDGVWGVRDEPAVVFEELAVLARVGVDGGRGREVGVDGGRGREGDGGAVVFEAFTRTTVLISSIGAPEWK